MIASLRPMMDMSQPGSPAEPTGGAPAELQDVLEELQVKMQAMEVRLQKVMKLNDELKDELKKLPFEMAPRPLSPAHLKVADRKLRELHGLDPAWTEVRAKAFNERLCAHLATQ
jgi:hypothetical protein